MNYVTMVAGSIALAVASMFQSGTDGGTPHPQPPTETPCEAPDQAPPSSPERPSAAQPPSGPTAPAAPPAKDPDWKTMSIWTLETKTLEGEPAPLSAYAGKVALVVNVASQCGLTPQYEGLEKLAREYKDKGLVVLGFPCNDFGGQEPGTAKEIRDFCTTKYTVSFPLFTKVSVKAGEKQAPLYRALEARTGRTPRWNFGKYLVGRDGIKAEFFDSKVAPDAPELREAIEKALAQPAPPR